ncbi:general substrate transporter [Plectosphaerella plurivora]|uniref:General substrate transporter n=1 Tax=Plectosphaerella plurivora TaxID=936078 RepID=A0A9P9A5P2_9PEZI|nr:general substrate transporter [Plectosphaerella plurivora]
MPMHAAESPIAGADLAALDAGNNVPWYKQPHLVRLNVRIAGLTLFASAVGYDGSLLNGLQSLPLWQEFMDHPTGEWSGFINIVYWIALGLSCPVGSWICNRFGRRVTIALAYIPLFAGAALQAAAQTQAQWIIGRALMGVPTAFYAMSVPLLITEIAHPAHRSVITALVNTTFFIGGIIAAWSCFGVRNYTTFWSWRIPCLLQVALPLAGLPALLSSPESPRWMISKGDHDRARQTIAQYHVGNGASQDLVDFEMAEMTSAIQAESQAKKSTSYLTMVSTPANRRRFFITVSLSFYSQWIGNGVVSYYLSDVLKTVNITSVTDQTIIMGCLQIWSFICAIAGALFVERAGRRTLFLLSCAIMLMSFVVITALSGSFAKSGSSSVGKAMIPFIYVFNAGYGIAVTPLQVAYPLEIWPYELRSRGIGLAWMVMVTAIIFNVFVNPIALAAIAWKFYTVFVVVLVAYGLTVYFFYPETKGHTLEEMATIFGDNPESKII